MLILDPELDEFDIEGIPDALLDLCMPSDLMSLLSFEEVGGEGSDEEEDPPMCDKGDMPLEPQVLEVNDEWRSKMGWTS
jgi:hypothetical protein